MGHKGSIIVGLTEGDTRSLDYSSCGKAISESKSGPIRDSHCRAL